MFFQMCLPIGAYALTAGPSSPEFSSFTPVTTSDMVSPFSGDFGYNLPILDVPGPHGSGYPLSLSYKNVASAEEEASWVGFGWNLNPGSMHRNLRGFPDDYNGNTITHYNKVRRNWTASAGVSATVELFSNDIGININNSAKYNNYTGLIKTFGFGLDVKGFGNIGFNVTGNDFTLNGGISPLGNLSGSMSQKADKALMEEEHRQIETYKPVDKTEQRQFTIHEKPHGLDALVSNMASTTGIFSYGEGERPVKLPKTEGYAFNWNLGLYFPVYSMVGMELSLNGSYSRQQYEAKSDDVVYGYMNSQKMETTIGSVPDYNVGKFLSDYSVEKSTPYSKRDLFLGIPFNNYDVYTTEGEGVSGGFRVHQTQIGTFRPSTVVNDMPIIQLGLNLAVTNPLGVGLDLGIGDQHMIIKDWQAPSNALTVPLAPTEISTDYTFQDAGSPFFRFNSDQGGVVEYSKPAVVDRASLDMLAGIPGGKLVEPVAEDGYMTMIKKNEVHPPINSANYIEYKKNNSIGSHSATFSRDNDIYELKSLGGTASVRDNYASMNYGDGIGAFQVTNTKGTRYVYDLPVYNKDEYQLRYNLVSGSNVVDNYKVYNETLDELYPDQWISYKDNPNAEVVGEHKVVPYASDYLMTHIFTTDYFDKTADGPSDDDFGGWTKFNYRHASSLAANLNNGQDANWYRWRSPYKGMLFHINDNADKDDDIASFSTGLKEVYYMKSVETSTHIAFFITNKCNAGVFDFNKIFHTTGLLISPGSDLEKLFLPDISVERQDGMEGKARACSANTKAANTDSKLEFLDKIILFSKRDLLAALANSSAPAPLKVVHFRYDNLVSDNSLAKGIPNAIDPNDLGGAGKLTLKKVWVEYQGIQNAKISPYIFNYTYKKKADFPVNVQNRYGFLQPSGDYAEYSSQAENPDYSSFAMDDWGNYQRAEGPNGGQKRHQQQKSGLYQGTAPDPEFDPAAYQLKQIILPTGGEILVQYEQDDYQYVQDRRAMALVSLKAGTEDSWWASLVHQPENKFFLNLDDIGITNTELYANGSAIGNRYCNLLKSYFINGQERVYFKYLYRLKGDGTPQLRDCWSDYITGYAEVKDIVLAPQGGAEGIYFVLKGSAGEKITTPRQACYDFVINNKGGKLDDNTCDEMSNPENASYDSKKGFFKTLGDMITYWPPAPDQTGKSLNLDLSYLKIPMLRAKRGGGLRVKRLMMYDNGIENGDAHLYGQEYIYKTVDGESSGVAVNEPGTMHEENALVTQLKRSKQGWFNKLIYGRDRKITEGPIGESLLPPASVGYSRVITKNIFDGNSSKGFVIQEFNTAKDYPFDKTFDLSNIPDIHGDGGSVVNKEFTGPTNSVEFTALKDSKRKDYMIVPASLFNYNVNKAWLTQGFRFIVNQMHGQPKCFETWGGSMNGDHYLIASQQFEYFKPGEKVKMLKFDPATNSFSNSYTVPGKEEDVCMEMMGISDFTFDFNFEIDLAITISFPPLVWVSGGGFSVNLIDAATSTHVTSKVLHYPAILKKKTVFADNVSTVSEYVAFNEATGLPIVTKTYDGHDGYLLAQTNVPQPTTPTPPSVPHSGAYYLLNMPASWFYPKMGQKSLSVDNFNTLENFAGSLTTYGYYGDLSNADWFNNFSNIHPSVIQANLTTYKNDWEDNDILTEYQAIGSYNNKYIYRPDKKYNYVSAVTASNPNILSDGSRRIYTGGLFTEFSLNDIFSGTIFSGNEPVNNWRLTSAETKYSPHGEVLEEKNALGIYSCAKFGYNKSLPTIVAQNGEYTNILFESFEDLSLTNPGGTEISADFHSGKKSLKIPRSLSSSVIPLSVKPGVHGQQKGLLVSVWVKKTNDVSIKEAMQLNLDPPPSIPIQVVSEEVASVNGWSLINYRISNVPQHNSGNAFNLLFSNISTSARPTDLYLDDIKIQPYDAETKCYVYNPSSLKMIAELNNNHFTTFYQYNAEGQLIRKLIETEKGVKTVVETHYNTKGVSR